MKKEIKQIIEDYIKRNGLKMVKKISSGGLFTSATYDRRTVYSLEELFRLTKEGFFLSEDVGLLVFNSILKS